MLKNLRSYWLVLPSAAIGLLGAVWLWALDGSLAGRFLGRLPWGLSLLLSGLVAAGLLGGALVLERVLPSFKHASRLLERALNRLPLTLMAVLVLALVSGISEEVFFRGALFLWLTGFLPVPLALVLQALVFAAFHPMPKRAWTYTAYTFVAGLVLGLLLLVTGRLMAAIIAHAAVNFAGFWEVYSQQRQQRQQRDQRDQQRQRDMSALEQKPTPLDVTPASDDTINPPETREPANTDATAPKTDATE